MIWGEAGDPVVEMNHLKQPDEPVGPLTIVHDHAIGHSRVEARANEYTVVMSSPKGSSLAMVATEVYGDAERKSVEMARRKLDRMVNEGKVHRVEAGTGRGHSALYFPIDQHRGEA
jgi:replicative DNA helicase